MDLSPFTYAEWELWSGAESWTCPVPGEVDAMLPPRIAYGDVDGDGDETYTAILDASGLSVHILDRDGEIVQIWSRSVSLSQGERLAGFLGDPVSRDILSLLSFERTDMGDVGYGPTGLA